MANIYQAKPIPRLYQTIGMLPTSYLMSMTYEEQLTWLCNYINKEIVPIVNANNEAISQIPIFEENVTKQLQAFSEKLTSYDTTIEEMQEEILSYNTKINELRDIINSNYIILKNYIDSNVEELNEKIDNIQIGEIQVYNPTTGVLSPLQIVINDLYGVSNKDGLTASEFDGLNLTATSFENYQITAYEFDSQGKTILI